MTVKRIVFDIATNSVEEVKRFYIELFELDVAMDQGWIATLTSGEGAQVQLSIASEGGSGTPVPDASIEVNDVNATFDRAKTMGVQIEYNLTDEPWGVRRFFLRDPAGQLINVLMHL
ncbi:MAG: VOC family protein [Lentilitoribacter sp.]